MQRERKTQFRVEELARAAKTTIRNVRAYQERGLLPAPRREGRLAFYDDDHLARLRTIGALLERGYSLANIAELLATWEAGSDLSNVLGLEAALTTPFTTETPEPISVGELAKLFGTVNPTALAKGIETGLLAVSGMKLVAPSMRLVEVGAELARAGIPLTALFDEVASLRRAVDGIAQGFVALVARHIFEDVGTRVPTPTRTKELATFVERVRPMAELVVTTMLAQSLERYVRRELGARLGKLTSTATSTRTSTSTSTSTPTSNRKRRKKKRH